MTTYLLDIIGDLHGDMAAMLSLGRALGYDLEDNWSHPEGRTPVFLGDLIDRGEHSLEIATLVRSLCLRGRAFCLMGNHEYNLVACHLKLSPGYTRPKHSNKKTLLAVADDPTRWQPILDWMATLPIALSLPGLSLVHACWHRGAVSELSPLLPAGELVPTQRDSPTTAWLRSQIAVGTPFALGERDEDGLKHPVGLAPGLPLPSDDPSGDNLHELLLKGGEREVKRPFFDTDGRERHRERRCWWQVDESWERHQDDISTGPLIVVGHYWNMPPQLPRPGPTLMPPYASGTPALRAWHQQQAPNLPLGIGQSPLAQDTLSVCVDFCGVAQGDPNRRCAGSLRWPERDVWHVTTTPLSKSK